jgi:hypothetical protein
MRSDTARWGIPDLRRDMLAMTVPPARTYGGGRKQGLPYQNLLIWRSCRLKVATGSVLAFYVGDERLECLWRHPAHYTRLFLEHEVGAVIEPDFSLWTDAPLVEQLHNVYRTRTLGRYWQEHGLWLIPSLNWSDERSYSFAFHGIPPRAPVVAVECRTASRVEDRAGFLHGLAEAIRQVRPQCVVMYGGERHASWIRPGLPVSGETEFRFLPAWTDARRRWQGRPKYTKRKSTTAGVYAVTGEQ